ncbi:substrate-binding domain-containing protein [Paenibacillus xerothermodurans]|uniref:Sugar ABC transporter substrate-binding protein n=1 Tax=Paenibacillus xerothermodurans TaxID=1977292 RepID=A0A2W1N687_PAEXE|nr:substrate-binding domain-containing protein [Paenibacillus xerothermodurans]PZE19877.1 sugar ABC transporter substrate-binding protein [Paenibacillus xerothermodurans]
MKKLFSGVFLSAVLLSLMLAGCGKSDTSTAATGSSMDAAPAPASGPITINMDLPDNPIMSVGPDSEAAVSAKTLKLTVDDIERIKNGNHTAAISLHYAGNDWSTAQVRGLTDTFSRMGIKIVAKTDANFKAEKQVADIETIMSKQPDILVSIPVDPVSTAEAFKKAAAAGTKLVFMDNKPNGLQHGKDYVSVVSADNYGNGVQAAHLMAEAIGKKGDIGVIYHDADFFVTRQRSDAFEKTIKEQYPDINIVDRGGIMGPNDGERVAAALLTKHPRMNGLFVPWDIPAEGALAAARSGGREDLAITTIDLGMSVAVEIALDGMVKGLGAQLPYDQGVAEAILAGYALLGKETPSYVAVPSLRVGKDGILDSWKTVYHADAPEIVHKAANQK